MVITDYKGFFMSTRFSEVVRLSIYPLVYIYVAIYFSSFLTTNGSPVLARDGTRNTENDNLFMQEMQNKIF